MACFCFLCTHSHRISQSRLLVGLLLCDSLSNATAAAAAVEVMDALYFLSSSHEKNLNISPPKHAFQDRLFAQPPYTDFGAPALKPIYYLVVRT